MVATYVSSFSFHFSTIKILLSGQNGLFMVPNKYTLQFFKDQFYWDVIHVTMQFTDLKYPTPWFLVFSQSCANINH